MATYQSTQVGTYTTDSVTVTKPTSLAVGEMMLAQVSSAAQGGGAANITATGWTLIDSQTVTNSGGGTTRQSIYYKIADSSDVSASNFTFSTNTGNYINAAITRITDPTLTFEIGSSTTQNTTGTTHTVSTITPTRGNALWFIFMTGADASVTGNDPSFSTYAMVTDNPTWIEIHDTGSGATRSASMASAYAARSESTASGNITCVSTGGNASTDYIMQVVTVNAQQSVSSSPAVIALRFVIGFVAPVIRLAFGVNTPTTSSTKDISYSNLSKNSASMTNQTKNEAVATNQTKSSSSWVNPDKSSL